MEQRQAQMSFSHGGEGESQPVRKEAKKVGRNDPCPCGSGKKFKKCCANKKVNGWLLVSEFPVLSQKSLRPSRLGDNGVPQRELENRNLIWLSGF